MRRPQIKLNYNKSNCVFWWKGETTVPLASQSSLGKLIHREPYIIEGLRSYNNSCFENLTLKANFNFEHLNVLWLFHVGYLVQNWRSVLSHNWQRMKDLLPWAWVVVRTHIWKFHLIWQTIVEMRSSVCHTCSNDYFSLFNQLHLWFVLLPSSFLKLLNVHYKTQPQDNSVRKIVGD